MRDMILTGAREGNLKDLSVTIRKNTLTVLTGVSGSGKSTLAVDVLFNECQRQYLEAIGMQGIRRPDIERLSGASPAILIDQRSHNRNPRSTVGTVTDIYTDLRMVYEKLHVRTCPGCGGTISAGDSREVTEKVGQDFFVYMICPLCGHRMDKLTRTHFSHNTREGACPTCQGLGTRLEVRLEAVVNEDLSIDGGAVDHWEGLNLKYMAGVLQTAMAHYGAPVGMDVPVREYTPLQKAILYEGVESGAVKAACPDILPPKAVGHGRFEGILPALMRRLSDRGGDMGSYRGYFEESACPDCHGERLNPLSRTATVGGHRLPELSLRPLEALGALVDELCAAMPEAHRAQVSAYLTDLRTKIRRIRDVGLGYLAPDRQVVTLSGGELMRLRLAAALDCDLTGMLYILDEPTAGLHPRDTAGLIEVLLHLRDLENTVLVIEHDPDVMRAADRIVDTGPGAGAFGGRVVGEGTLAELMAQPQSVTGQYLLRESTAFTAPRAAEQGFVRVHGAALHNLKGVDARFPLGCLTAVTGVSGSGKSSLVFGVLAQQKLPEFDRLAEIGQASIARMRRSNVATYSGAYDEIRNLFAKTPDAMAAGLTAKHFSFNAAGGRCERCEGLGEIESNMLFFENIFIPCPECGGHRFKPEVLQVELFGRSVSDVLKMPVEEALRVFSGAPKLTKILALLDEVGLSYLQLGQSLTTLSGGEGQRLKLMRELQAAKGKRVLYLMDEPTTGLHPLDVERFLALLNRMVAEGHTVICVEHNMQLVRASDWVVDLGPDGGDGGGEVLFEGKPEELAARGDTATAAALRG